MGEARKFLRRLGELKFITTKTVNHAHSAPPINSHDHCNNAITLTARFSHFAQTTSYWTGHPFAFLLTAAVIVVWVVSGPFFHYSDTWQLVINTGTTIVTFLMVFLIQNTQNRDMMAVQLKLSELVLGLKGAKNKFVSIEDLTDSELQELHNDCRNARRNDRTAPSNIVAAANPAMASISRAPKRMAARRITPRNPNSLGSGTIVPGRGYKNEGL